MKKISVVIPCHNEELGIGKVLDGIPYKKLELLGFNTEVIVVDNNSTDKTAEVARRHGATVHLVKKTGKGHAIKMGFHFVSTDTDYVVMLDGDATYKSEEIVRMVEPLDSGFCDVVVGSRLEGKTRAGALSLKHRIVNWGFTFFARRFYQVNVSDILTGYFAWKKEALDRLLPYIVSKGFAIEAEMITKMAKMGISIYSVPITYAPRAGNSKISPLLDGLKIVRMLVKNLGWEQGKAKKKDIDGRHIRKLAFVSDSIWPYNKGGKEKRLFDISTRLTKDFDVHVYTMKWWKGRKTRVENGVTLHAISKKYPLYSGERRSIKQGIMFGISCLKLLWENWDVIDVDHMPFFPVIFTKIVCLIKRKPMIATWHEVWGRDYWIKYLGETKGNIASIIERLAVRMPDKFISISKHTTDRLINDFKVSKEVTTIPIGLDVEHIETIPPSETKTDVTYIGRLIEHKNADILIESIDILKAKYPKIKCTIIGTGPEKHNLQKQITEHNLTKNIFMVDQIADHDELYAQLKSSKVLVLPSSREGFGIVMIEANACGVPTVTVDEPDNAAKDLSGISGKIAKLNNRSLAHAISYFLDTKKKVSLDNKYSWGNIMDRLYEEYI